MNKLLCLSIISIIATYFAYGQEKTKESTFFHGCWTGVLFDHIDINAFRRCEGGSGPLTARFKDDGTYWIYSSNLNMPQRCGNYLVKKINYSGKYKYDSQTRVMKIFNSQGRLKHEWELYELEGEEIGIRKKDNYKKQN
ncbi:hypothetical protein [Flagellimonas eckloniae]|uniref:Lipocalin-like domain-containing protein n=1 Tax=Flagellimonas eckloniae TaxID=346185 RepID=A0A0N8WG25_9FLAO|nr:hypothetical protein [Allomuricauda eckloniae]KQC30315.1 hypothetical protein AAY42_10815 [Allomuricauda eckloniae]